MKSLIQEQAETLRDQLLKEVEESKDTGKAVKAAATNSGSSEIGIDK